MGDVFVKAVERIEQRAKKAKMVAALAPLQVGIGVPGGAAVASAVVEAILRADTEKHMLNIDIRNMFNELCRVTMMEDILESEDFLGEDFSDLAAYIDFAYGEEFTAWFRVDAAPDSAGPASSRWERVDWARAGELPGPLRGSRLQGRSTLFGRDRSLRAALVALQLRYASPTS